VTSMTDPDWEPVLHRAKAIVTDQGGRTCHAAIVSRELGIPWFEFQRTHFNLTLVKHHWMRHRY
jgi:phosphohistidine swiveling domain-containing protein